MSATARKLMSTSAFRSAASRAPSTLLGASNNSARPSPRHFVALASSQQPPLPTLSSQQHQHHHHQQQTARLYSLDRPGGGGSSPFNPFGRGSPSDSTPYGQSLEMASWPITKTNTILNIVPQGQRMVVERLGKLHAIHESGYFIAIPFVDTVAYVIDVRERAIDIVPQAAITRDNVSVEVSGNLFVRVVDPERAAYGARNPLYAVMMVSSRMHYDDFVMLYSVVCNYSMDIIWRINLTIITCWKSILQSYFDGGWQKQTIYTM